MHRERVALAMNALRTCSTKCGFTSEPFDPLHRESVSLQRLHVFCAKGNPLMIPANPRSMLKKAGPKGSVPGGKRGSPGSKPKAPGPKQKLPGPKPRATNPAGSPRPPAPAVPNPPPPSSQPKRGSGPPPGGAPGRGPPPGGARRGQGPPSGTGIYRSFKRRAHAYSLRSAISFRAAIIIGPGGSEILEESLVSINKKDLVFNKLSITQRESFFYLSLRSLVEMIYLRLHASFCLYYHATPLDRPPRCAAIGSSPRSATVRCPPRCTATTPRCRRY